MERENNYDLQEQADLVITEYVHAELEKWQMKAVKHNLGSKDICNCPNCMKETASNFNTALVILLGSMSDEDAEKVYEEWHLEVEVTPTGSLALCTGHKEWTDSYDSDTDTGLSTT